MPAPLIIIFIGLLYLAGFFALSKVRREGFSAWFAAECLAITFIGVGLALTPAPLSPLLFLAILYLVTMRTRLLVDLGNWFTARGDFRRALKTLNLALHLKPDATGRVAALISQGVTELLRRDYQAAYQTLSDAANHGGRGVGAKYLAALGYNLGVACRGVGREGEAVRHFREAVDVFPLSIYARAAERALREHPSRKG